jgi:hypothetical protein
MRNQLGVSQKHLLWRLLAFQNKVQVDPTVPNPGFDTFRHLIGVNPEIFEHIVHQVLGPQNPTFCAKLAMAHGKESTEPRDEFAGTTLVLVKGVLAKCLDLGLGQEFAPKKHGFARERTKEQGFCGKELGNVKEELGDLPVVWDELLLGHFGRNEWDAISYKYDFRDRTPPP